MRVCVCVCLYRSGRDRVWLFFAGSFVRSGAVINFFFLFFRLLLFAGKYSTKRKTLAERISYSSSSLHNLCVVL